MSAWRNASIGTRAWIVGLSAFAVSLVVQSVLPGNLNTVVEMVVGAVVFGAVIGLVFRWDQRRRQGVR